MQSHERVTGEPRAIYTDTAAPSVSLKLTGSGARTLPEFMEHVRALIRSRQRHPQAVQRYFPERHVRYAAAEGVS
jgi:hypothetical protein